MLLWVVCYFLNFGYTGEASNIDAELVEYREKNFVIQDQDTGLIQFYLSIRQENYLDSCIQIKKVHTLREEVLRHIYLGHCELYGPNKSASEAYVHYLAGLAECQQHDLKILEIECLRSIIKYGLLTKNNLEELESFIARHKMLAYDRLEELQNQYFQMRYMAEKSYLSKGTIQYNEIQWLQVINECQKSGYYHLETELRGLFALVLELDDKVERALDEHQRALISARKFSEDFYEKKLFIAYSNMGFAYLRRQQYIKALDFFKETLPYLASEPLSNQVLVYQWMAETYHNLTLYDSAYHYLDLAYNIKEEEAGFQKAIAVKEIQSKYDNERLGWALAEESLKRKQNNLIAFYIGGSLLSVSLFIWFLYDRQRRKNLEISQDLEIANKEIQLTAVNARLDGQEQEKKNLASYLHDHIVGQLVAANMHLKIAGKNRDGESIRKSAQLVHDAGIQLRNKSHDLYPPVLLKLGLGPALEDLCKKYTSQLLHFNINPKANEIRFTGDSTTKVYFSVQELLNNVTKHSQASQCKVVAEIKGDHLFIEIEDNGLGLQTNGNPGEGLGINTVRSRIETLGGSFSIQPASTHGLRQEISVPLASLTA